jgi:hypothetical protein
MLNTLIPRYNNLNKQIKELEAQKKELKSEIQRLFDEVETSSYEDSKYKATFIKSQRVSYDHQGMSDWLLSQGITQLEFSKPQVDIKKVEDLIASGHLNPRDVMEFSKVTDIQTLVVKEK